MIATTWKGGPWGARFDDQNKSQAPWLQGILWSWQWKIPNPSKSWNKGNKGNLLVMQNWMKHNHYHLVMTNSSPWKITMLLRTVNHLFRLGPSIFHGQLLVITRLGNIFAFLNSRCPCCSLRGKRGHQNSAEYFFAVPRSILEKTVMENHPIWWFNVDENRMGYRTISLSLVCRDWFRKAFTKDPTICKKSLFPGMTFSKNANSHRWYPAASDNIIMMICIRGYIYIYKYIYIYYM